MKIYKFTEYQVAQLEELFNFYFVKNLGYCEDGRIKVEYNDGWGSIKAVIIETNEPMV